MPTDHGTLRERLSHYSEVNLSVTGRKTGRTITNPVWFVFEGDTINLLPVQGSDTQWYKNVLQNPSIRVSARGAQAELQAVPVTDPKQVSSVVEKFRSKYGVGDVKKYYTNFDVAVLVQLR